MHNTYGYIRGTEGVDGDHIDVFLSDDPTSGGVYVVDQVNPKTGEFDEHKVMYGFPNIESAKAAYLSNYEEGWQGLGAITPVSKEEFKKRIDSSHRKTKPFSEYKSANPIVRDSKGNVVPLSKRFDLGGSRYLAKQKGDGAAVEASPAQRAVQRMLDRILGRIFGNDYKMDAEEGQRTLDMFRELARLMGGPKRKTTSETAKLNSPEGEKAYVTVVSDAESGAKVRKNLDTLEKKYEEKSESPRTLLKDIAEALGGCELLEKETLILAL